MDLSRIKAYKPPLEIPSGLIVPTRDKKSLMSVSLFRMPALDGKSM